MAIVTVHAVVPRPELLSGMYTQLRVYKTEEVDCAGAAVGYERIGDPIELTTKAQHYTYEDRHGRADDWYCFDLYHPVTQETSEQFGAVQGVANYALDVLSPSALRSRYLFGVDLTDDAGNDLPDEALAFYIESAVDQAEQILDLPITPKFAEERYDFIRQEYAPFAFVQLDQYPVLEVERFRVLSVGGAPNVGWEIPTDWLSIMLHRGQVHVVPLYGGTDALSTIGASRTPMLLSSAGGMYGSQWVGLMRGWANYVPGLFSITYRAGFGPENGYPRGVPKNIVDFVGMLAAFGPLNIAGDMILGAGIARQVINLDAISTEIGSTASATNAGYGARLLTYGKKLGGMQQDIRRYFKGIPLVAG